MANERSAQYDARRATGEVVSVKSWLGTCEYPFATRRALYQVIELSGFSFSLKTHLHLTAFLPGGSSPTCSYVPFHSSKSSSSCIAAFHFGQSGLCFASMMFIGSL